MVRNSSPFGEYLKQLIKEAGMSQCEFYTALGIKKPYFYDIVSGRINPPPSELQFKAAEILKLDEDQRKKFYDLAAKGRGDVPADIAFWIAKDPEAVNNIRNNMQLTT